MEIIAKQMGAAEVSRHLDDLAARHARAASPGLQVLNLIGGQAENLLDRLPGPVRDRLDAATVDALTRAMEAAHLSRGMVADSPGWMTRALTTAMGAAGGWGGLPTALAELPITTTILLRAIQDAAVERGFSPQEQGVRFDCVQVFAAAGPLDHDDGADMGFLSTRLALSGTTMRAMIARVAPQLATVLGQKLAAQTVPVLGAAAGAATNYAYTTYYQQMAHVHFGLRRLAIDSGRDHAELVEGLRERLG